MSSEKATTGGNFIVIDRRTSSDLFRFTTSIFTLLLSVTCSLIDLVFCVIQPAHTNRGVSVLLWQCGCIAIAITEVKLIMKMINGFGEWVIRRVVR